MHSFTFNGLNSRDYCELYVSGSGTFNSPERDYESVSVPGRNGELTIDHGCFKNIQVSYSGWIAKDFDTNAAKLRSWLCSAPGYKQLIDDYHPDEIRMARFKGPIEFNTINLDEAGAVKITFDCQPQRFLSSGQAPLSLPTNTEDTQEGYVNLHNFYAFDALPFITIVGTGSDDSVRITIAKTVNASISDTKQINIMGIESETILLDSEIMRAYTISQNNVLYSRDSLVSGAYPILTPGNNILRVYSTPGITSVSIKPRWWTV